MDAIQVHDLLGMRALVTRGSARVIQAALAAALQRDRSEVTLDFSGVEAVTPSFVDEVLSVVDETLSEAERRSLRIVFLHPPTRLSTKFTAVGRRHGLAVDESSPGTWTMTGGSLKQH